MNSNDDVINESPPHLVALILCHYKNGCGGYTFTTTHLDLIPGDELASKDGNVIFDSYIDPYESHYVKIATKISNVDFINLEVVDNKKR